MIPSELDTGTQEQAGSRRTSSFFGWQDARVPEPTEGTARTQVAGQVALPVEVGGTEVPHELDSGAGLMEMEATVPVAEVCTRASVEAEVHQME